MITFLPDPIPALRACRNALADWVEIADDEDQRESDWRAIKQADKVLAAYTAKKRLDSV